MYQVLRNKIRQLMQGGEALALTPELLFNVTDFERIWIDAVTIGGDGITVGISVVGEGWHELQREQTNFRPLAIALYKRLEEMEQLAAA